MSWISPEHTLNIPQKNHFLLNYSSLNGNNSGTIVLLLWYYRGTIVVLPWYYHDTNVSLCMFLTVAAAELPLAAATMANVALYWYIYVLCSTAVSL